MVAIHLDCLLVASDLKDFVEDNFSFLKVFSGQTPCQVILTYGTLLIPTYQSFQVANSPFSCRSLSFLFLKLEVGIGLESAR